MLVAETVPHGLGLYEMVALSLVQEWRTDPIGSAIVSWESLPILDSPMKLVPCRVAHVLLFQLSTIMRVLMTVRGLFFSAVAAHAPVPPSIRIASAIAPVPMVALLPRHALSLVELAAPKLRQHQFSDDFFA